MQFEYVPHIFYRILRTAVILLLSAFVYTGCSSSSDPAPPKTSLTFGLNPSERSEETQKNAAILGELISAKVGMPVKIFVAQDYSGLVEALRARTVDFAFLAPVSYVYAERIADARVLLKAERSGSPYYYGAIVVRSDGPYRTIEDLRGKQIAWVDPSSASGHIFPKAALIEAGVDPETFFERQTFAGGHDAVLLSVINGTIDAGATFANDTLGQSGSWTQLEEGGLASRVRPIFYSAPIPGDNLATSAYMIESYPEIVAKVTDAVAAMHLDSAGAQVMHDVYHVDAMVPARSEDYDPVRRAAELLDLDVTGEIASGDPDRERREERNTLLSWLFIGAAGAFGVGLLVLLTVRQRRARVAPVAATGAAPINPDAQFSLRDVRVVFRDRSGVEIVALDGVSLDVSAGEFIAIIGPSGAGKSTLLRAINRTLALAGGSLAYRGDDVSYATGRRLLELRRRIGFIFQQFNLVGSLSVMQNVLAGRLAYTPVLRSLFGRFSREDRERARGVLAEVGLTEKVGGRAGDLSGGQQQRVAIARALAQEPEAILADEPTASLDPVLAAQILDVLGDINRERGITIIANLHSIELARDSARRIIGLRAGKVVFDGTPEELTEERVREIYREEREETEQTGSR